MTDQIKCAVCGATSSVAFYYVDPSDLSKGYLCETHHREQSS